MKDIEDFLRENKPVVKADPTFVLETQRRLEQVEGIKTEVDRQRHHGFKALVITLTVGLVLGVVATALAFLYPIDATSVQEGLWQSICAFLHTWKQYVIYPVAAMAIALSLLLSRRVQKSL